MSFLIKETFQLSLPDYSEKLNVFQESEFNSSHGLITEIAAVHVGTSANYNYYSESALEKSISSWIQPYQKPIILNHNTELDPIGRVVGARMDKEADGTPFTRLQAAIVDPASIQKINDKRYLTGSVGGKADEAICSICDTDWAAPRESGGLPCKHSRGNIYKGKLAVLNMESIDWKEYSFVNVPADTRSGLTQPTTEQEGWERPVRFFVLDLKHESIVEYTSGDNVDVLGEMKKKDASPMYKEMKGAFIEAQVTNKIEEDSVNRYLPDTNSVNGIEENSEEKVMSQTENTIETETEDDILAVTEQLSEDLSTPEADTVVEEEENSTEEQDEEVPSEDTDSSSDEVENQDSANETEVTDEVTEPEEGQRPEGQEKPHAKDVDAETSKGAPISREADEEDSDEETEDAVVADDSESEQAETETEEPSDEVKDMQTQINTLQEENTRLKKALHHTLAERVVDAKIHVGLVEASNRAEMITEHASRSAGSLADSLRDLATMPVKPASNDVGSINVKSVIVEQEKNTDTIGEDDSSMESDADPEDALIDTMTDVLMGRRSL